MSAHALSISAWLSPAADRRRQARHPVDLPGAIDGLGDAGLTAIIRDISTAGFQAECDADLRPDTYVRLRLPVLGSVAARVVWCAGGRMGAEFLRPIDSMLLRRSIEAAQQL